MRGSSVHGMPASSPHGRPADEQRAARLDARLALYAQYASLVGHEVAAAWSADPVEAAALTRQLARTRAAMAEHYDELREAPAEGEVGAFGDVLADVVTELAHQRAIDQALRARLDGLQLGAGAAHPALPAGPGAAGPDAAAATDVAGDAATDDAAAPGDGLATLGGALVAARSGGVGGALGGQYPGIAAGGDPTAYVAAPEDGAPAPTTRLDVRF